MNPIEHSLRRLYHSIPPEILDVAFRPRQRSMTLDACIHEDVIVDRVIPDINVVRGKPCKIVLNPAWIERVQVTEQFLYARTSSNSVYRIPPEAREFNSIVEVVSVNLPRTNLGTSNIYPFLNSTGANGLVDYANAALEMQTMASAATLPTPVLVSGSQVELIPASLTSLATIHWILDCRIAYDEEFTNLNKAAYGPLAELVECAVKAYIYNFFILKMDKAHVEGGMELGKFRDIIESYSENNTEKYNEKLMNFRGGSTLDPKNMQKMLYMML